MKEAALTVQFQEGSFIRERQALHFHVSGNAFEIFRGERLDGWIFGFANPGDFEFHARDLITEPTEQRGFSPQCSLINLKTQRSHRTAERVEKTLYCEGCILGSADQIPLRVFGRKPELRLP